MPTPVGPQLDYAPPPSRIARLRRFVLPLILIAVVVLLVRVFPRYWAAFQIYRDYRACATYVAPPAQVVIDSSVASDNPPGPAAWRRFYNRFSPPGLRSQGTVFLHERQSPDGARLLIAIDYVGSQIEQQPSFIIRRLTPATPTRWPTEKINVQDTVNVGLEMKNVRLFAGQIDPNDPTHFTIDFEKDGTRGLIDGWVRTNGSVVLELNTASTQPAPASPG